MPHLTSTFDHAQIYYQIYNPPPSKANKSQPTLVFSHGWPFSSRVWDQFVLPLVLTHGYRCVVHDRRGHGKSDWAGAATNPEHPVTYDVLADDFAQVIRTTCNEVLGDGKFIAVGQSMGCGEVTNCLARHSDLAARCDGVVFLGSNLPNPMKTEDNPGGNPVELWQSILDGFRGDRQGFVTVALDAVFGKHVGIEVGEEQRAHVERMVDQVDGVALEEVAWIMSRMDFTQALKRLGEGGLRVLVVHGDADQSLSVEAGAGKIPGLVKGAELKVYEKAAHGLWLTHRDQCIDDMLKFFKDRQAN